MFGVLALQGGFREHASHMRDCGYESTFVRRPKDLLGLRGLIIPGGESTCLRRLLRAQGLDSAIAQAFAAGLKVWGTCAGAILCASEVMGEEPCLSLIDCTVERNVFGSQLASFEERCVVAGVSERVQRLVYIRAPGIRRIGSGVVELHRSRGIVSAAQSAQCLITTFHPELGESRAFHRYFIGMCGERAKECEDLAWDHTRWML